jgi:hypothetical protein
LVITSPRPYVVFLSERLIPLGRKTVPPEADLCVEQSQLFLFLRQA